MNENTANSGGVRAWKARGSEFMRRTRMTRRRLAVLLAVLITFSLFNRSTVSQVMNKSVKAVLVLHT